MRRVSVVGDSCSGKTTFATDLAEMLGVPLVELDALNWQANWTIADLGVFQARVSEATSGEGWLADGNYASRGARDILWPRADTVVWLDLPLWLTLVRMWRRTVGRIGRQESLWGGNQETIHNTFFTRESLFLWALRTHRARRRNLAALTTRPENAHITFHRLRSPAQVATWLAAQRSGAAARIESR